MVRQNIFNFLFFNILDNKKDVNSYTNLVFARKINTIKLELILGFDNFVIHKVDLMILWPKLCLHIKLYKTL